MKFSEHIIEILAERDARYGERFAAQQEAIRKAEISVNDRLAVMNEFRGALGDQAATYATRVEMAALRELVRALEKRADTLEGRSKGLGAGWGFLVGGIGIVAAVIGLVVRLSG
jgi:hypothetical protein